MTKNNISRHWRKCENSFKKKKKTMEKDDFYHDLASL